MRPKTEFSICNITGPFYCIALGHVTPEPKFFRLSTGLHCSVGQNKCSATSLSSAYNRGCGILGVAVLHTDLHLLGLNSGQLRIDEDKKGN